MPASLDVTQTPNPVPVDTPSIVANLDTNTGPQADPAAFGPNLNGLAQGLDQANQDIQRTIYQGRYERMQTQEAQNSLASENAAIQLDKQFTARQLNARSQGQPIDPEKFDADFQASRENLAATMPNTEALARFNAISAQQGAGFYRSNLEAAAQSNQHARGLQLNNVLQNLRSMPSTGSLQGDMARADQVINAAAPAVDSAPAQGAAVKAQIIGDHLNAVGQTYGGGQLANTIRTLPPAMGVPVVQGEIAATQAENGQQINIESGKAVANQQVAALGQAVASGVTVSPATVDAAATAAAAAATRQPVPTNPPDLSDFIQQRENYYSNLNAQLDPDNIYDQAKLQVHQQIENRELSTLIDQRLLGMPLDQQQAQLAEMRGKFGNTLTDKDGNTGEGNPLVRFTQSIVDRNTHLLTKGDPLYAPALAAAGIPKIATETNNALAAMQSAKTPADIGTAQGLMKTAVTDSFSAQRLLGVAPGQEQVLTPEQAKQYPDNLNGPADYQKLYSSITNTYNGISRGDGTSAGTIALQQVFDKKGVVPGAIQLAGLNPNQQDNWAAASYVNPLHPDDPKMKAIQQAVENDPTLKSFGNAQQSDPRWAAQHDQWSAGLVQMAAYQMAQHGVTDPTAAVAAAVKNTIASKYSLIKTDGGNQLAIPIDFAPTTTDASALQDKANIALTSLQRDAGAQIGQTSVSPNAGSDNGPGGNDALRWHQVFQQGRWVYDASSKSLVRYQTGGANGDAPFLLSDGRPLAFSVAGLKGSNVMTNMVPVPLHAQDLGPNPTAEDVAHAHARTIEEGQTLDVNLNGLIPAANASTRAYFPLTAPVSQASPSAAATPNPSVTGDASDDWQANVETTHYAYKDDNTPDRNSKNGIGAFGDNPLTPGAVALSPSMEARMKANPGDVIEMQDAKGDVRRGYFADRTSQKITNDRVDLYDPHGSEAAGSPFTAVSFRNRGGGIPGVGGRRLSAIGERNLAVLEESQ
jgi:hypothetical protein